MRNILTIDVEDYWSVFSRDWLRINAEPTDAVLRNTKWFLEMLAKYNTKATFFILGEVAKSFPSLVKKIAENGHEIGSHGCSHKQIFELTKEQFRQEITDSKKLLEDIISGHVYGYRAPAFSIMPKTKWALEVLVQEGFKYDSSVFPIMGSRYGWPGFSRDICKLKLPSGLSIIEVPMSTISFLGKTLPTAGGGYIRHFPYWVTRWAIRTLQKNRPVVVYLHPYEIDSEQFFFETTHLSYHEKKGAIKHQKMQFRNRNTMQKKIIKLLSEFEFTSMQQIIKKAFEIPIVLNL